MFTRGFILRRTFLALLLSFVALAGCSRSNPTGPAEGHLRVVTWNLEWFPGRVPEPTREQAQEHMAAAREALLAMHPDVLLLQEIRDWNAAAELVSISPGLEVKVASQFGSHPQNQVVAADFEADSAWSERWKHGPVNPPRGYAFAALPLPGGRFLLCYSLHLKSNQGILATNIAMRRESIRQLLQHVGEMLAIYGKRGPCAVIVAGDLNSSLDDSTFAADPSLRAMKSAGFHWTHEGVKPSKRVTIPGNKRYPDNCFDHLFTLGLGKPTASVPVFKDISDHRPVQVDIDLRAADFQPRLNLAAGLKELASAPSLPTPAPVKGILNASDDATIRAAVGQTVTIRGKVSSVGATASGSITFINFSGNQRGEFVAIVRQQHLASIAQSFGGDLRSGLASKTIDVRGRVQLFKSNPQIVVTQPEQISISKQ